MFVMVATFSPEVYSRRLAEAQRLCVERKISGLIVGTGPQFAYLTGSWLSTHERFTAVVIPATGKPSVVAPAVDRGDINRSVLGELDVSVIGWVDGENPHAIAVNALALPTEENNHVGIGASITADHLLPIQTLLGAQSSTILATEVLAELFTRKDDAEIAELRRAGAAIDVVHSQVPALLQPGKTEREVAQELERLILREHTAVDFVIVGSMENGANPHHDFSDRSLEAGDMVVVDIGGTFGPGYHSDCTRTYIVGGADAEISEEMAAMYNVLFDAQRAAVAAVRPTVTAAEIDKVARDIISEAGYGEFFIHRTGHGIGLSTHEEPFIMAGNDLVLEPGMAFSVEPGIYLPGKFGARIEDIVVVTESGCQLLNNQPRQLQ
ncbi:Xaa-Pro aminopeptidase [Corynebacterium mustelae]|uniref:Xaa-Pro aminopeptidase n=2 Tax=Corynebacterium mustelae TaxID=571915 RepID=A0A0G3GZG3_9CORY|nr:Xaa-Pro aminopeptidase [Corynebacterium mustelae]